MCQNEWTLGSNWRANGCLFHTVGPTTENARVSLVEERAKGTKRTLHSIERSDSGAQGGVTKISQAGKLFQERLTTAKLLCTTAFITWIYIAPLQGYYSEALSTLARLKRAGWPNTAVFGQPGSWAKEFAVIDWWHWDACYDGGAEPWRQYKQLEVIPVQSAYHYRLTLLYPLLSSTVPTPPIHTTDVVVVPV